ncbi:MAG: hypothetical protein EA397_11065 [Deltaproteobacteria bacterium]|nr:MAG: hypothetical protein EA397_11065 [Deltaproteobacteria bacterium]
MTTTETLAQGVQALRDGRATEAARLLAEACADPDFATAPEVRDLYARACSLQAQALLLAGQPSKARKPLRVALDLLEALHDEEGLRKVRELEREVGEAMAEDFAAMARRREQIALSRRSLSEVLAELPAHAPRAEAMVKWSLGALADGRADQAIDAATRAVAEAASRGDVKHQVLAHIALASAEPERASAHLEAARSCADGADDFNLVGAVARAAEQAGVQLPIPDPLSDPA